MSDRTLRPTIVDIDLDALGHNFTVLRDYVAPARMMCILKANAYGHGLVPCGRILEEVGAEYFGVAFLNEALELRNAGIKTPVLVLGGVSEWQIDDYILNDIDITASSVMKLDRVETRAATLGKKARVHLKIDTGMERLGVHYYSATNLLERASKCRDVDIVGVFSHLALAEQEDLGFTEIQLRRFLEAISTFKTPGPKVLRHIANSGGILQLRATHLDMVRPGLALYGVSPLDSSRPLPDLGLKRAFKLRSEVVYFKVVRANAGVGYGQTWTAPTDTRLVTVPVGYGDGYPRRLSNRGMALIRGKRHPIVGRVCMDQFMVNIGPDGEAYNGDDVVLIGEQGSETITIEEVSRLAETDPRDILVTTNLRIPRRFTYRGNVWIEQLGDVAPAMRRDGR